NGLVEIFFEFLTARTPLQFLTIENGDWLQTEMSFSDKYGSGHVPLDRTQKCQGTFQKVESSHIRNQRVIVKAKALAQDVVAKLAIHRVGICKFHVLRRNRDADFFTRYRQFDLEFHCGVQIQSLELGLETISRYAQRVRSGFQIGRRKLAGAIGSEHDRLRQISATDLN